MRTATAALLAAAALGAAACGDDDTSGAAATTAAGAAPAETETQATPPTTATTEAREPGRLEISKDRSTKPSVPKPTGDPPTKLVVDDVVKGKGKAAKAGDEVTVDYVGVSYTTGEQFDASWDRGEPFKFALGAGGVIQGWDRGVVGMKKGGRRLLVIPPDLAYGPQPPPGIAPNETLVFVIDLKRIG